MATVLSLSFAFTARQALHGGICLLPASLVSIAAEVYDDETRCLRKSMCPMVSLMLSAACRLPAFGGKPVASGLQLLVGILSRLLVHMNKCRGKSWQLMVSRCGF